MDDLDAIAALTRNDPSALDALIERYQTDALRVAYMITRDRGLAEDAVQDAFIRVYRSAGRFDKQQPFKPWLLSIVVNRALDLARRSHRETSLDEVLDTRPGLLTATHDSTAGPIEQVEAAETRDEVIAAMRRLTPKQRAVVVQRYFLEMSHQEMADRSGRAVGTVKHVLFQARQRLRSILGPDGVRNGNGQEGK